MLDCGGVASQGSCRRHRVSAVTRGSPTDEPTSIGLFRTRATGACRPWIQTRNREWTEAGRLVAEPVPSLCGQVHRRALGASVALS
jgi:hypothetical protein